MTQVELSPREDDQSDFRRKEFKCGLFSAEHVEMTGTHPFDFSWSGDAHYLALHDLKRVDGETFVDSLPRSVENDARRKMTFLPAGCEVGGWTHPARHYNSYTAIMWDKNALAAELPGRHHSEDLAPRLYFQNRDLLLSMSKLEAFLKEAENPDQLYGETLGLLIAMELTSSFHEAGQQAEQATLSSRHIRQIEEYVQQNLSRQLTLADLAAVADLSRFHFARTFRTATGESPTGFVRRRRIEKSSELLRTTKLSIADIAGMTAFNGTAQFSRAFKQHTGISPSEFRRSL